MGRKKERFQETVASSLELPGDLVFTEPVLTMIGQREICIENYRGILSYSQTSLQILTRKGKVTVKGENLTVLYYRGEEMKVGGKIAGILFEDL